MNPEIEKLIDLAIADGQITEKERNVILKKAAELGVDADEVEMTLDGKLHQLEASKPKQKEKVGNIKTCPACGASANSFNSKCVDCGHEFRSIEAVASSKNLSILLNEAADKIKTEKNSFKKSEINWKNQHLFDSNTISKEIHIAQAFIISSFPIPNAKEDLLEFLAVSSAEANKLPNSMRIGPQSVVIDGSDVLINAWNAKLEQVINKAKFLFNDDNFVLNQVIEFQNKSMKSKNAEKSDKAKKRYIKIFIVLFGITVLFGLFIYLAMDENREKEKYQSKMDNIEQSINSFIQLKQYDNALILTEQLVWSYRPNVFNEEVRQYEAKRKSCKETIEKIKNSK